VSQPRIIRVDTAAVRIVGPCLILRLWAGDTYGLGECYPSAPAALRRHEHSHSGIGVFAR
jgi:hypothetical protein